jgi:hypothetical protein
MEKEITDIDNYANWLKWVSDAKRRRHTMFESINCEEIPVLLQVHEVEGGDFNNNSSKKLTSFDNDEINRRWKEIY